MMGGAPKKCFVSVHALTRRIARMGYEIKGRRGKPRPEPLGYEVNGMKIPDLEAFARKIGALTGS
jgi:hypothetical protein